jgi:hypothetical protein
MMKQPSNDPDRVTEEVARELLARAAALDIGGPQLAHLREAAIEAGISGAAFDQAVHEWKVQAAPRTAAESWALPALRNLGAFASGWGALAVLGAADRLLGLAPLIHKLTDPIGLLVGAIVAIRLRARTAAVVLSGLVVSQGAEFLMDLLAGGPAIQGLYAHIGLMVAGIGGVAASQLWRSRGDRGASSTSGSESEQSSEPATSGADDGKSGGVGLTNAEADKRFIELLRLRRELLLESFAAQVAR